MRVLVTVTALALALVLGGAPTVAHAPVQAAGNFNPGAVLDTTQAVAETPDNDYLSAVADTDPALVNSAAADLIVLADTVCGSLDRGVPFEEIHTALVGSGIRDAAAAAIVSAAVPAYCPELSSVFTD